MYNRVHGLQVADAQHQFLENLPSQGCLRILARLNFAAGEFPETSQLLSDGASGGQYGTLSVHKNQAAYIQRSVPLETM